MTEWEYASCWYEMRADTGSKKWAAQVKEAENRINDLGQAGWEMVNVSTSYKPESPGTASAWMFFAMFKRPIAGR